MIYLSQAGASLSLPVSPRPCLSHSKDGSLILIHAFFNLSDITIFFPRQYDVFKKTDVDVSNGPPPNRTQVARIMALIIESGALYSLVWASHLSSPSSPTEREILINLRLQITIIFTEFIKVPVLSKVTHVVILTIPIGVQLAVSHLSSSSHYSAC